MNCTILALVFPSLYWKHSGYKVMQSRKKDQSWRLVSAFYFSISNFTPKVSSWFIFCCYNWISETGLFRRKQIHFPVLRGPASPIAWHQDLVTAMCGLAIGGRAHRRHPSPDPDAILPSYHLDLGGAKQLWNACWSLSANILNRTWLPPIHMIPSEHSHGRILRLLS